MTEPDRMFEEEIRRALRTAGDLVVPAGDGLHKIRERTVYRPRPLAWLLTDLPYLLSRPFTWLRVLVSEVAAIASGHSSPAAMLRSARRGLGSLRAPGMWMRPVLSAAGALALVLAVVLAVPGFRKPLAASLEGSSSPAASSQGAGGSPNGGGTPESSSATAAAALPIKGIPGQPVDALMLPKSSRRCANGTTTVKHSGQVPYVPPGPTQTVGGTVATSASAAGMGQRAPGGLMTAACTKTASPTTPPPIPPPTTPVTTPPTTPVTTPPSTTPVTTPPSTTPVTTPPTTTPVTTPPSTSTSDGSASPSGTATPG